MGKILSKKLVEHQSLAYDGKSIMHWCPGCEEVHSISIEPRTDGKPQPIWSYNNVPECPTFTPSINYVSHCHYFITGGMIQFLGDSKHLLAGQTVALPDFPTDMLYAWGYIDEHGNEIADQQH